MAPQVGGTCTFAFLSPLSPPQPQAVRSALVGKGSRLGLSDLRRAPRGPGGPRCPSPFPHLSASLDSPPRGWDGPPEDDEAEGETRGAA